MTETTNQLPTLYTKTASGTVNEWRIWTEGHLVRSEWGQEGGSKQQASYECAAKNAGRANETTAQEQATKEALATWTKKKKKKYYESRHACLTTLNLKPMLAKSYKDHKGKVKFPATVQPKLDGLRCFAFNGEKGVELMSRGGDPYLLEHLISELHGKIPPGVVLDGELYTHDLDLQTLNSLIRRPQADSVKVGYSVYDLADKDDPGQLTWEARHAALQQWFGDFQGLAHTSLTPSFEALSHAEIAEAHDNFVQEGYEGAIVRIHHGRYKFAHRSAELLKVKSFQDDEFKIIGWRRGKGKFWNVPIFRCVTESGGEFDCTPKGTEAQRNAMLGKADTLVGQLLKVQFFALTQDGIPQFPVGLAIRHPSDL